MIALRFNLTLSRVFSNNKIINNVAEHGAARDMKGNDFECSCRSFTSPKRCVSRSLDIGIAKFMNAPLLLWTKWKNKLLSDTCVPGCRLPACRPHSLPAGGGRTGEEGNSGINCERVPLRYSRLSKRSHLRSVYSYRIYDHYLLEQCCARLHIIIAMWVN